MGGQGEGDGQRGLYLLSLPDQCERQWATEVRLVFTLSCLLGQMEKSDRFVEAKYLKIKIKKDKNLPPKKNTLLLLSVFFFPNIHPK